MANEQTNGNAQGASADGGAGIQADAQIDPQVMSDAQIDPQVMSDAMANTGTGTNAAQQAAILSEQGHDPSDTYTHGVPGANVNTAVPEGAYIVSDHDEALQAGYYGYAPGHKATEQYSVSAQNAKTGAVVNGAAEGKQTAEESSK